ncbi:MAG: hypothetical protein JJE04_03730 [Acidobacteriia bacterium]|nr:hypothetical protein [Terriglobia bacterium]
MQQMLGLRSRWETESFLRAEAYHDYSMDDLERDIAAIRRCVPAMIDLLHQLFIQVLMPQAVMAELLHEDAPEAVRGWTLNLPSWISAQENSSGDIVGMEKPQAGAVAAITLARSINR